MNQRVVVDPFNPGSKEVDAALGNAYPVVRKVYDNLQALQYLAENLEGITSRDVELNADDALQLLQWRYVGETDWRTLTTYEGLLGEDMSAVLAQLQEAIAAGEEAKTARDQAQQYAIDAGNNARLEIGTVIAGDDAAASITGEPGNQELNLVMPRGEPGLPGDRGVDGKSAYELAVEHGFVGTEEDFLLSLKGLPGEKGDNGDTPTFDINPTQTLPPGSSAEVELDSSNAPEYKLTFKIPAGQDGTGVGDMLKSDNLAGLSDYAEARTNLGLGNVDNTSDADKPVSTAQQTALDLKQDSASAVKTVAGHGPDGSGNVGLSKGDVGLSNVDNTADVDKPISNVQQAALALKANISDVNAAMALKVDKVAGKALSTNDFSDVLKTKLENLNEHYKGTYISLAALQAAVPSAVAGDYAQVDAGVGTDTQQYNWDANDNKWVQGGSNVSNTDLVSEGTTNLYFTAQRVRDVTLTGVSFSTSSTITNADSVLSAFGKLQAQNTALTTRVTNAESAIATKEPALPAGGTTAQFLRGDKTWATVSAGGATGGGSNKVFYLNDKVITENYTIPNNTNAGTFGEVTIADGVEVIVGDNSEWTIV